MQENAVTQETTFRLFILETERKDCLMCFSKCNLSVFRCICCADIIDKLLLFQEEHAAGTGATSTAGGMEGGDGPSGHCSPLMDRVKKSMERLGKRPTRQQLMDSASSVRPSQIARLLKNSAHGHF